jgi:DNA-binding response OmpR family regulator
MTKQRIMLVDDEAIVRDSISEWLKGDNYDVECACDGKEALNKFNANRFDTAVVDLKMPGIDGLEVMKQIKQISPQTVVIIITAYGTAENAVEAMKMGADDYLTKPFTMDKLENAINEIYRQRTGTGTITPPAPKTEPVVTEQVKVREEVKEKPANQCVWSKAGIISYRVCINNFRCDSCEFAQTLMDKGAQIGDRPMMIDAIKKMLEKPGPERACRYMLSGQVPYRLCSNVYRCGQCAFNEAIEDKLDAEAAKMTAKIKSMQERKAKKVGDS